MLCLVTSTFKLLFYTLAVVAVPHVVRHLVLTPARPIIANTANPAKMIKPV